MQTRKSDFTTQNVLTVAVCLTTNFAHSLFVVCSQEKESIEARLNDNDKYIVSLQDKIKELVNSKDALMGKNRSLEEEKDMYKVREYSLQ